MLRITRHTRGDSMQQYRHKSDSMNKVTSIEDRDQIPFPAIFYWERWEKNYVQKIYFERQEQNIIRIVRNIWSEWSNWAAMSKRTEKGTEVCDNTISFYCDAYVCVSSRPCGTMAIPFNEWCTQLRALPIYICMYLLLICVGETSIEFIHNCWFIYHPVIFLSNPALVDINI